MSAATVMEVIGEINDLACNSIESGDYQIALDVLNSCLGCVKQLKKCRVSVVEEWNGHSDGHSIIADMRQSTTKENVTRLLKGAKRKLLNRSATAAATAAVLAMGNKRKALMTASTTPATAATEIPSTERAGAVVTVPPPKRRRRAQDDPEFHHPDPVSSGEAVPSLGPEYPIPMDHSCPMSVAMPSQNDNENENSVHNLPNQNHQPQCCRPSHETEEQYFVFRKPLRLTRFQWSQIAECQCPLTLERERKSQCQIDREVELAVSSNLIFNIALSHHLIASSQRTKEQVAKNTCKLSPDTNDEADDENGCGYDVDDPTNNTNTLGTDQRLKGALRLYELGFRVHTKRVANVTNMQRSSYFSMMEAGRHSITTSTVAIALTEDSYVTNSQPSSFFSRVEDRPAQRRVSGPSTSTTTSNTATAGLTEDSLTRSTRRESDREDELKSTTRFALALLNNCAHIHEALGQTDKAKVFQKRLLSFLLVIVDSGESIHDIIGDDTTVDGYLKNVFAATVFDKDTAPAAVA